MATSPLNPTKHLQRQGLDHKIIYAGIVVDDNDPRHACRVRVRITGIHPDAIPDNHLPWALPMNQEYATDGDGEERSGHVEIPQKGSKVGIKFPNGDPHKPQLAPYPGDKKTILPEAVKNYPYRVVIRYKNGCYLIADTKTNELFITNPGDTHIVMLGDCTQTTVGTHTQIVTGSKSDVPSYLLNASDTKIQSIQAKSAGGAEFKGSGGKGSMYTRVTGDYTLIVEGKRTVQVAGNDELKVGGNRDEKVSGQHTIDSSRSDTN
jgi:hypothetical protein